MSRAPGDPPAGRALSVRRTPLPRESCYSSTLGSIGMQIDSIGIECGLVGENAT